MKKKKITKPIPKARPTITQILDKKRRELPLLVWTIRDRRAVIHWPATLDKLANLKSAINTRYGVSASDTSHYIATMSEAVHASGQWPMCSCGSLCRVIPRMANSDGSKYGAPVDQELRDLGLDFHNRLVDGRIRDAEEVMDSIEARAAVLLRQIGKKKHDYRPIA